MNFTNQRQRITALIELNKKTSIREIFEGLRINSPSKRLSEIHAYRELKKTRIKTQNGSYFIEYSFKDMEVG
jgi:hypothetical protein